MRTVLVLAAVVTLACAGTLPSYHKDVKTENVDATTVQQQYRILELLETIKQVNIHAEYYTIGKDYDIKAHITDYKNEAVVTFFGYYEKDFIPKYKVFTIFNEEMRQQAIALFDIFFYAKDFEAFYKAAAWARIHVNSGMFAYSFYLAVVQRADTQELVLPAFYEVFPELYVNYETFGKMHYGKLRGAPFEEFKEEGIVKKGNDYVYYANYSDEYTYGVENKLAYLTEDIGWNAFYSYFHALMPFWQKGEYLSNGIFKERRGEIYFHFYKQLLARYYLERLSNGLGEIPRFSWYQPFKYGYRPLIGNGFIPFAQRTDNYVMQNQWLINDLRFVRNYEDMFLTYLQQGQFKAFNKQVDLYNSKAINFVGNFWQTNPDVYEKVSQPRFHNSYEVSARRILSGAPHYKTQSWNLLPSALDFYQTSLRDPAFYQIYNKIVGFMLQYKKNIQPYSQENLHYVGVKVNHVEVSELETYFELTSFNASNGMYYTNDEFINNEKQYLVVQPRLNQLPFNVKFSVKSDVEEEATFKVFIGPKYDSYGQDISFEDNWMNFVELDWFTYKLNKGENVVQRNSQEFFFYKEDSMSTDEITTLLAQGKLPADMLNKYHNLPRRLMLPRGNNGGFPLQVFVVVYKTVELPKELKDMSYFILDDKPLGYPLDRPVTEYFLQPNMYVQDVAVHHKGQELPVSFEYLEHTNNVIKH